MTPAQRKRLAANERKMRAALAPSALTRITPMAFLKMLRSSGSPKRKHRR
jgi:hypothetical protein